MKKPDKIKSEETKKTILIVDDDMNTCSLLTELLQMGGYHTVTATDGMHGWKIYKGNKPDLVLTDLVMPGMGGVELLQKIRGTDQKTPVIILTGFAVLKTCVEAMKLGAFDFVEKPLKGKEILSLLQKALLSSEQEREDIQIRKLNEVLIAENTRLEKVIDQLSNDKGAVAEKHKFFFGAIDHSLKGELMHIGRAAKNIQELSEDSKDILEECELINRSIQYSLLQLRRMLNYLDIGKSEIEAVDIIDVLKRTEALIRPRLRSNIDLKIDYSSGRRLIKTNSEQLMEVLIELVQNAVNALGQHGGNIEVYVEDRNNEVSLSVKDNASGVREELRGDLFNKEVKSKGGLGIGLFLYARIIHELGGRLVLESTSEKGSIFSILMPKADDELT